MQLEMSAAVAGDDAALVKAYDKAITSFQVKLVTGQHFSRSVLMLSVEHEIKAEHLFENVICT